MDACQSAADRIHAMMTAFMPACVVGAAAELDVFTALGDAELTADELATKLDTDPRATAMLLDAVAALDLLDKRGGRYKLPRELQPLLVAHSADNVLSMIHLRMRLIRTWDQLAWVTKTGSPAEKRDSIRGADADRAAFVAAMHTFSEPVADDLVARIGPPSFSHLLDVGGASGTWTMAFLRTDEHARATIFDLPDAVEQARRRLAGTEFAGRVDLVAGDFYRDDLPPGADLAWVSAIVHQHSRRHNRELFAKVFAALEPGGRIAIRDVVMEPSRTVPLDGALFAINMLVNTDAGATFTFDELAADLTVAGFSEPELRVKDEAMDSVVIAVKANS